MLIWPAGGVGLAAFLLLPKRLWPALVLGFFTSGITADVFFAERSFLTGLGYMTGNMVESIGCAWLILHFSKDFRKFNLVKEVLALIAGTLIINALSSCIGAATSVLTRGAVFSEAWQSWYISDGLGILLIGPFIVVWTVKIQQHFQGIPFKRIAEGILCVFIWTFVSIATFYPKYTVPLFEVHPYFLVAIVAWPAIRFGQRGITTSLIILLIIAVTSPSVVDGPSPWPSPGGSDTMSHRMIELQIFVAFLAIVGYLIAAGYENLREVEANLKEREEKFRLMIQNSNDAFVLINKQGEQIYISDAAIRDTGYAIEELKGPIQNVIYPDDLAVVMETWERVISSKGEALRVQYRHKHKYKEYIWYEAVARNFLDNPAINTVVVNVRDITKIKEFETALVKAKVKAEESDRLKTAFLQNMSHEIRTPMNAIMGFSDLLTLNFNNKDKLEKYADIIKQRSSDLLDIINDILDISKIESGQLPVNMGECNISELFSELNTIFSGYRKRISKEHVNLILHAPNDPATNMIISDKIKLKQIFINLIGNAFKFTDKGSVTVDCRFDYDNHLTFSVSDTGIGIPVDKQKFIFERFAQLNQQQNKSISGTGLGLSIVRGLVNLLEGEITLESTPEKGSTFSFTIPVIISAQGTIISAEKEKTENYRYSNETILIVEDDYFCAEYLKEILSGTNLNILHTEFGKEAVRIALSERIDLILMDIRLPDLDGYEATRQIRERNKEIKIIAQTAYASPDEKQNALDAGCNDYISKPAKQETLLSMLNKYLAKHS